MQHLAQNVISAFIFFALSLIIFNDLTSNAYDAAIQNNLTTAFKKHKQFNDSSIKTYVGNGTVTLMGTVQSKKDKYLADIIAANIEGVNKINDFLNIKQ